MRVRINAAYEHGWLTFESRHDKWRLAPVPDHWKELSEAELEQLCERAISVGRPRRLIE